MERTHDASEFATFVGKSLRSSAADLTDEWIEELGDRLGVHPSSLLPTEALRDHVPEIIEALAAYVVVPIQPLRDDVDALLAHLAELRREQGYDVTELLTEFEILQNRLSDCVGELAEEHSGEASVADTLEVSRRMYEAMMMISQEAARSYRTRESAQLKEFAERLSTYTRAISHELKNPLSAANTAARILKDETVSQETRNIVVDRIIQSLDRADDLIHDMKELAVDRFAGASAERVPLRQIVQDVFEDAKDAADEKGVALEVDGELPNVSASRARLQVPLRNLVGNAIKYCDPDKEERWVRIGAEHAEDVTEEDTAEGMDVRWTIRVSDNGLGIPEKIQHKVFQEGFRAHPEVAAGTGLGLSLIHFLVTERGGQIRFESTEGEGTAFYLTIPARQERPEEHGGRLSG